MSWRIKRIKYSRFWGKNESSDPGQKTRNSDNKKEKKREPSLHPLGRSQSENQRKRTGKYLDLAKELSKLQNMWVMMIT